MEGDYFSEWLPRFAHYLRMRNFSPRTIESYEQEITRFARYIWLRRHSDPQKLVFYWNDLKSARTETEIEVPPVWVTDFLAFLSSVRTYKAATLHRVISTLSSFYRFCTTQGAISANPLAGIERPRIKEKELVYLKHNQVLDLLSEIDDPRDHLIVRTIYATGVRVSELSKMCIEDIDFSEHTIRVTGKGGKIRIVFVDEETLAEVRRFIGNRRAGPLFPGQQGHPLSPRTIQHIFKQYAPNGITPHKIRHSYASELYRRSHNLRVVQENLGHSSIKTTEIYLHTDLDERKRVYRRYFPLSNNSTED
ncbi:MAG: tyrosine-type recombinase/integrase [Methanomicrobiaceae archaeon]|nr:tyrosine-type recombinase/integrase [Methanomicrobiaceae archaeon]